MKSVTLAMERNNARRPKHVTFKDPCDFVKRFYGTTTNNETRDKQTSLFVPLQTIWISSHEQECELAFHISNAPN